MTTTVTLKTHDWPCAVQTNSSHNFSNDQRSSYGHSSETVFVPANTERTFSITDTTSVTFSELPADATGLAQPELAGAAAAQIG